jgi:hypothetical protein
MRIAFRIAIVAAVIALSLSVLDARQRGTDRPQPAAGVPEVFCDDMQAGALCPIGTVGILKLSGPTVQQWLDLVRKYNETVENATKQLKTDAKAILTPAQLAELDRWMDKGINPEVNRILASRTPAGR